MEEKELPFEYKPVGEDIKSFDIEHLRKEVFGSTSMMPGSGEMLALKIMLQCMDNFVLVGSEPVMTCSGLGVPFVNVSNPAAFAQGLANSMEKTKVVVFVDQKAAASSLPAILKMKENVLFVCYNNTKKFMQLAKMMPCAATASVAFHEDFIIKLKKFYSSGRFSYLEVLAPNPSWGYETSNTIEIARLATECLLWPVYEVEDNVLTITKRPDREEPVSRFFSALKIKIPEKELQQMQEEAGRNWKMISGKNQ